jgi:endonuclease YncB( thermonuclease family)
MTTGLLEARGAIDRDQLWPKGHSDADTLHVDLDVADGGFRVRPPGERRWRATHAFDDAIVVGRVERPAIDARGRLTVRLQGIDAPELHYRPAAALGPGERTAEQSAKLRVCSATYRQACAESAAVALARRLERGGAPRRMRCRVVSTVEAPDQAFDTYGRFVGGLHVATGEEEPALHLNHWLVRYGWAFPALYVSMSGEEILSLRAAALHAQRERRGVWASSHEPELRLAWATRYRPPPARFDAHDDRGPVLLPKLFRRLAAWAMNRRAEMLEGTFEAYLAASSDVGLELGAFLGGGRAAPRVPLSRALQGEPYRRAAAGGLLFEEAPSSLVRRGVPVERW